MPRIIKLNVGGVVFQTASSTLAGSTYFSRLLSDDFNDLDAHSGEVFVDRDGRYFHFILGFLRSGTLELPQPPLQLEGLLAEAEYFAIDALCEALRAQVGMPITSGRTLRADGSGMYVHQPPNKQNHECVEAIYFLANPSADGDTEQSRGTLVYSRGPCARQNIIALQAMPKPLPRIWRESGDASTIVAYFTQRFLSRGHYEIEDSALLLQRGHLADANAQPGGTPQNVVATVGMIMSNDELLLLEPSHHGPTEASRAAAAPLLEQLGLSVTSSAARGETGLGGGFKRFVFEPMSKPSLEDLSAHHDTEPSVD